MWQQQIETEPLYPDIIWNRPEQKRLKKRLIIIGGHVGGFNHVAICYQAAIDGGIGEVKVVLPSPLKSIIGTTLTQAVYGPAGGAGSFSEAAFDLLVSYSQWADGILFMQVGNNSATARMLLRLITETEIPLIVTDEMLLLLQNDLSLFSDREHVLWTLSFTGIQKLIALHKSPLNVRHDMGIRPFALALESFAPKHPLVTVFEDYIVTAKGTSVISTRKKQAPNQHSLAGWLAPWWLQQIEYELETITCAAFEI